MSSEDLNMEPIQDISINNRGIGKYKGYDSKRWSSENADVFNSTFDIVPAQYNNTSSIARIRFVSFSAENSIEILLYEK